MDLLLVAQAGAYLFATVCLALGTRPFGLWQAPVALLGLALIWLGIKRKQPATANAIVLVATFGMAAVGMAVGASAMLMAISGLAGLVFWDLAEFRLLARDGTSNTGVQRWPAVHAGTLGVVVFASIAAVTLAPVVEIELPFTAVALLALLLTGSLTAGVSLLKNWGE